MILQETLNNQSGNSYDWATKICSTTSSIANDNKDIRVKLLCGADLLESFAVPGLWKDEDV